MSTYPSCASTVICDKAASTVNPKSLYNHHDRSSRSDSTKALMSLTNYFAFLKSTRDEIPTTNYLTSVLSKPKLFSRGLLEFAADVPLALYTSVVR